jgi:uncharacterized protein YajQ (UPF0234 family)
MDAKELELTVTVKGEITKSNFDDFKIIVSERIEGLNFDLTTDEEFGQAELDVKALAALEKNLATAEVDVLKQMDEVYSLVTGIKNLKGLSAENRLKLSKKVKSQKEAVKEQIKLDAIAIVSVAHPLTLQRVLEGMKGKRNLESLKQGANEAAEAIEKDVKACRGIVASYKAKHGDSVLYDSNKLLTMGAELLTVELERRVERKLAEAEKAKLQAKLDAEKTAKDEAEAIAKQEHKASETVAEPIPAPVIDPVVETPPAKIEEVSPDETAKQEMARFLAVVPSAFAPVKEARSQLKHAENIEKAGEFAKSLGEAWVTFKSTAQ